MPVACHNESVLKPLFPWSGGKRQLLDTILPFLPSDVKDRSYHARGGRYIEPFVGGGALLWRLQPSDAIVGDLNQELIGTYRALQWCGSNEDRLQKLTARLDALTPTTETLYQTVRSTSPVTLSNPLDRAARFTFLMNTCYGGLYRENKRGVFNTSWGKKVKDSVYEKANLAAVCSYLGRSRIDIECEEYRTLLAEANVTSDDFVFLDPPYVSQPEKRSFVGYTNAGFDHDTLVETVKDLDRRGTRVMVCNANVPAFTDYFTQGSGSNNKKKGRFEVIPVKARRGFTANTPQQEIEVIVRNYK